MDSFFNNTPDRRGNLNIIQDDDYGPDTCALQTGRGRRPPRRGRGHRRGRDRGRGEWNKGNFKTGGRGASKQNNDSDEDAIDSSKPRFKLAIYGDEENSSDEDQKKVYHSRRRNSEEKRQWRGHRHASEDRRGLNHRYSRENRRGSISHEDNDEPGTYRGRGRPRGRPNANMRGMQRAASVDNIPRGSISLSAEQDRHERSIHNRSKRPERNQTRRFGYRKLCELSSSNTNPDSLVMELTTSKNGFKELITEDDLYTKSDWMILILEIIVSAFKSSKRQSVMELFTLLIEYKFIPLNLSPFLNEIHGSSTLNPEKMCKVIESTCSIVRETYKRMQAYVPAVNLVITMLDAIVNDPTKTAKMFEINPNVKNDVEDIKRMRDTIQEVHEERSRNTNISSSRTKRRLAEQLDSPPDDFRKLPILPALKDLQFFEKPFLRANKTSGGYSDLNHYLDVQFRLLREDYVQPLRNGIADYRRQRSDGRLSRKLQDIRLYEKVQIIRPICTHKGILHMLQFDVTKLAGVRWESSRRLMYGSLLCLSADDFESIVFATVTGRDIKELSQGLIQVRFEQNVDEILNLSAKERFVMAETTAYFEAYRYILEGLQEISNDMPLQRYIIRCETTMKPPKYLLRDVIEYDFAPLVGNGQAFIIPVINSACWPSPKQLQLDDSQHKALKMAITKELAIIQGPPGTGKTFVGLKIVQLLLHNKRMWTERDTDPILVVCYTNHALDQFLLGIAKSADEIVRIGGRCKTEELEEFMLKNLRQNAREKKLISRTVHERKSDCIKKMAVCRTSIETVSTKLHVARTGILNMRVLQKYMSPEQCRSLDSKLKQSFTKTDNPPILKWLGIGTESNDEENVPSNVFKWKRELIEGNNLDPMTQDEVIIIENVWNLPLIERGALYKTWVRMYQNALKEALKLISDKCQQLVGCSDPQRYSMLEEAKTKLQLALTDSSYHLISEHKLHLYIANKLGHQLKSLESHCPQKPQNKSCIDVWLCIDESGNSDRLIAEVLSLINENFIDAEEEAAIENEERQLNEDGYEEEMFLKQTKALNQRIIKEAIEDMSLSSYQDEQSDGNENGNWITARITKKKLESEMTKILNVKSFTDSEAQLIQDVWILPHKERARLYRYWLDNYLEDLQDSIRASEETYSNLCQSYQEVMDAEDVEIMRGAEIIGMTTTGAAKYRKIIQQIQPKIIIVEEAAEVLESHLVTTINPNCQHLILIGDHKQLRPTPTVYELVKKYNLDISLFERMVKNEINYTTLQIQHRMRPEISLLMRHIYENLKDADNVKKYNHVKGVGKDVFFIDHVEPESSHDETKSKSNKHEAIFLARFCRYLIQQGYTPNQITVLTTYTGQVLAIKKQMPKKEFDGVRITAVDNFQGEENDIILLSLVRSNNANSIGFLKIENRICVALSRARMGFYVIGNFKLLAQESSLWENMVLTLIEKERIGPSLTLQCQNHPTETAKVSTEKDFLAVPNGGCKRMCNYRLECGHVCEQVCHPEDQEHKYYKCFKPCQKIICSLRHICKKKCFADCGNCTTLVKKVLPQCNHEQEIQCSREPLSVICDAPCQEILGCGHLCKGSCGICRKNRDHAQCTEKRMCVLSCGHTIEAECYIPLDKVICSSKCSARLDCGHYCVGTCSSCLRGKIHVSCQKRCGKPLICGHICNQNCGEPCPPCKKNCPTSCTHSRCRKKCGDVCDSCSEPCEWKCKHHSCDMKCGEPCNRPGCSIPCEKKLSCGCRCLGFCQERCPQICPTCNKTEFMEITKYKTTAERINLVTLEDCGHVFEASFLDEYMRQVGTEQSTSAPIEAKKCPKCPALILKSKRYPHILKKIMMDINIVKKRKIADEISYRQRAIQIVERLKKLKIKNDEDFNVILKTLEEKRQQASVSPDFLDFIEIQIEIIMEVEEQLCHITKMPLDNKNKEKEIQLSLQHIREWTVKDKFLPRKNAKELNQRVRKYFTEQELRDVRREITRLFYTSQFDRYFQTYSTTENVAKVVDNLMKKEFTEDIERELKKIFIILVKRKPLFNEFSPPHLKMVSSKSYRDDAKWYKCNNGHINEVKKHQQKCTHCDLQVGPGTYLPSVHFPPSPTQSEVEDKKGSQKGTDVVPYNGKDVLESDTYIRSFQSADTTLKMPKHPGKTVLHQSFSVRDSPIIQTLQPGIVKSQPVSTASNESVTDVEKYEQQKNLLKYIFKCSNGHHGVYSISQLPNKCKKCESTEFIRVKEVAKPEKPTTIGRETAFEVKLTDTNSILKQKHTIVTKCREGHVMPQYDTECPVCTSKCKDDSRRIKHHINVTYPGFSEEKISHSTFGLSERLGSARKSVSKEFLTLTEPIAMEKSDSSSPQTLTERPLVESTVTLTPKERSGMEIPLLSSRDHSAEVKSAHVIHKERPVLETSLSATSLTCSERPGEEKPQHGSDKMAMHLTESTEYSQGRVEARLKQWTSKLDALNIPSESSKQTSESIKIRAKPIKKCTEGHVMLRNETECSWCNREQTTCNRIIKDTDVNASLTTVFGSRYENRLDKTSSPPRESLTSECAKSQEESPQSQSSHVMLRNETECSWCNREQTTCNRIIKDTDVNASLTTVFGSRYENRLDKTSSPPRESLTSECAKSQEESPQSQSNAVDKTSVFSRASTFLRKLRDN